MRAPDRQGCVYRQSVRTPLHAISTSSVQGMVKTGIRFDPLRALRLTVFALLAISGGMARAAVQIKESPAELIQKAVDHEVAASNGSARFMFTDHKETAHGSQTELLVETSEAMAGMVVAINGKPLTGQQRRAEEGRLARLLDNPDELRKKQKAEREDSERVNRIVKALPNAFLYEVEGTEIGTQGIGKPGDELIRLKFRPNPKYQPSSRVEQVLLGMQGVVAIDAKQHRIARIDGSLIREVSFGWGILGHLDKGGRFFVEQGDVGQGAWEITRMDLAFTGKILLIKSLSIKSKEVFSDFRPAPPNLTFAQGVEMLKKQAGELAETQQ